MNANTFRFAYRLPLLLWHALVHLPITLLLMLPPLGRIDVRGEPLLRPLTAARSPPA